LPLETTLELTAFQGPLDLLLSLIERRRVAITDISLASVADQYLQAVHALPEPDADLLGEFLVIGARLLLLKSRALLPRPDQPDEDEPLDDLVERLEEYRQFKEAALCLATKFEASAVAFPHPPRPALEEYQPRLEPIEAAALARIWRSISRRQPARSVDDDSVQPRIQVADRLELLRQALSDRSQLCWEEIAGQSLDEVIATFLALLELVRRREIHVRQDHCFGPIVLEASRRAAVATNGHSVERQAEDLD
jgi:segregation and condensation protein A